MLYTRKNSLRWSRWNYGFAGEYFITICTKNMQHCFGEVIDGEMILNDAGRIVEEEWLKTLSIRADMNVELGVFQIMPNHFHGIVVIGYSRFNCWSEFTSVEKIKKPFPLNRNLLLHHSVFNRFGPQRKNLSSVIRGFKSAVTNRIRWQLMEPFAWKRSFHDHVIRNSLEYMKIERYIANNPQKWSKDRFRSKHQKRHSAANAL